MFVAVVIEVDVPPASSKIADIRLSYTASWGGSTSLTTWPPSLGSKTQKQVASPSVWKLGAKTKSGTSKVVRRIALELPDGAPEGASVSYTLDAYDAEGKSLGVVTSKTLSLKELAVTPFEIEVDDDNNAEGLTPAPGHIV
eukprot:3715292-Pleurochrysis_carterae.AAC.2